MTERDRTIITQDVLRKKQREKRWEENAKRKIYYDLYGTEKPEEPKEGKLIIGFFKGKAKDL